MSSPGLEDDRRLATLCALGAAFVLPCVDAMVKWLVDPPMPDGGYWKPDPERPGNGIELNPHAVAQ